jgi:hypothetical protein
VAAQTPADLLRNAPRAQVLVLGVFHFQDAGLDSYKPQFAFDIRNAERQRELQEVLDRLAEWRPTRILVERQPSQQARLDSLYQAWPGAGLDTLRNEIYQIGFKLAKRLEHPGVFAIDAPARRFESNLTEAEWNRQEAALRKGPLAATNWDARFTALYRYDDSLKTVQSLRDHLRYINTDERLALGHGHYLVGNLLNGEVGDFFGADGFVSAWHNRNIRIYSNIVRLIRSPDERLLVIIGAGHVPILRHALGSSPVVRLVNVDTVLR